MELCSVVLASRGERCRRMKRAVGALFVTLLLCTLLSAQSSKQSPKLNSTGPEGVAILPVSQIQPGMRGVAYTVFEGVTPEAMDVEVLGVMKNSNGPRGDLILVRLHG